MTFRSLVSHLLIACSLIACGGGAIDELTVVQTDHASRKSIAMVVPAPVVFPRVRADYTISTTATGYLVTPVSGTTAPVSVGERDTLRFTDGTFSFDLDGIQGQAFRIYQAAFNRTPDAAGLGFWINAMQQGTPLDTVAAQISASAEFVALYGIAPTNLELVKKFYVNVLHREGEPGGIAFWTGVLDNKTATRAQVLAAISEGAENQVGVLPAIVAGIKYQEPGVYYLPVANPGAKRNVAIGSFVNLDGTASSSTGAKPLTYSWTMISKPADSGARLVLPTTARPAFSADVAGVYEIGLIVNDGTAASVQAKMLVIAQWSAPVDAVPAKGNYVYLQSDTGDYIGAGRNYLYTRADAIINFLHTGPSFSVNVGGDQDWNSNFVPPNSVTKLVPGYYGNLTRYPFHTATQGGLSWSGEGRGCNTLTGWFLVESVTYVGERITAIEMRFGQHCEGGSTALRGQIRWAANDSAGGPGPVPSVPAGLWSPEQGSTPQSGNFVYLSSSGGDYIGGGRSYLYTRADSAFTLRNNGAYLSFNVAGDQDWSGDFAGTNSISKLAPGFYNDLSRYPFHNAVKGGLNWSGEGRGCNTLKGWFAVDSVTYSGDTMTAIELRFQQHCEGGTSALNGQIRWNINDATPAPGPVLPIPSGLWSPPLDATPSTGNYVYLSSMAGDYIGGGATNLYTASNSTLTVSGSGNGLRVGVGGYNGEFYGMSSLSQLKPGYYGDLSRYPFHNAVKGGLNWSGNGRGCNTLSGWFVVDSVTYVAGKLTAIDLRFQQHCEGGSAALRGKIHYVQP